MTPLLNFINDDQEHKLREIKEELAAFFKLTDNEKATLYPRSNNPIFSNRVHWARLYLIKAGLIESPIRGIVRITSRGKEILHRYKKIDLKLLQQFPEYREFKNPLSKSQREVVDTDIDQIKTPQDLIEESYMAIRQNLARSLSE